MKTRPASGWLAPALFTLVTAVFAAEPSAPPAVFFDPADPAVAEIKRLGENTIDHAARSLLAEVKRVLQDTQPAMALDRLHLKTYALPAAVPGRPAVTALRRTSLRVRDPLNAPDGADLQALQLIQSQLEKGEPLSKVIVQRVGPPTAPEWRVYRPLASLQQCGECHGPPGSLAPGVSDQLHVFFPSDQAVGFEPGSWRGLIRVSLTVPPAPR